jgi:heat shock protein 1/8
MKHWPFKVVAKNGDKPYIRVNFKGEEKEFTPEEISAMVLVKMKETAEAFMGSQVKDAVVTGIYSCSFFVLHCNFKFEITSFLPPS